MKTFRLVLLSAIALGMSGCALFIPPKLVLVSSNTREPSDQIRECVRQLVSQGIDIRLATKQCGDASLALPAGSGISLSDVIGAAGRTHRFGEAACSGTSANPMIAEEGDDDGSSGAGFPPPVSLDEAKERLDKAKEKLADTILLDLQLEGACGSGKPAACVALIYEKAAINLIIAEAHYYANIIEKATGTNPIIVKGGIPVGEGGISACNQASELIESCNRGGWRSFQCLQFERRMKGCAAPRVANVDPGSPENCELSAIDESHKKSVAMLVCKMKTTPGPDTDDPCEKVNVQGNVDVYRFGSLGPPGTRFCNDPRALITGDDCVQTMEVSTFGKTDLKKLISDIGRRFGGPVILLPEPPKPIK
jgi:hypothetical protein